MIAATVIAMGIFSTFAVTSTIKDGITFYSHLAFVSEMIAYAYLAIFVIIIAANIFLIYQTRASPSPTSTS